SGEKLKTTHTTAVNGKVTGQTTTEYRGNVIYRDGKVDMVLFPGGYATIDGNAVIFHYYTQDYLGNNRAVINGSTGAIEQTVAYYPYGGVIADLGTNPTKQQYKFGGKELITTNGLNEYDFGARNYYPAVPAFTRIDPMAEKYLWLSPYLYCANNPVNYVDPTGMVWKNPEDAERILSHVQERIQNLENQVSLLETDLENPDLTEKEKSLTQVMIKENKEKITLLNNNIGTMEVLGADQEHEYAFESTDGSRPHVVRLGDDGTIFIQASSDALALHEITHVGQSLKQGELVFIDGVLSNASTTLAGIAKNETIAYRTQYAMDPCSLPIPTVSINFINYRYLKHIMNPQTGKPLYPYLQ
ncbi:MAG: hypothetical protein K2L22_02945, partial [Muribaculaceae bacterium]|nr:hypothetical protein [Muribaculaceae bacterium]